LGDTQELTALDMATNEYKFKTLKAILRKIREIAHKSPSVEVCGFLGFDKDEELFIIREESNTSPTPSQFFLINPLDYLLFKDKYEILGLFHSHVVGDEQPSDFDIKMAQNCCLPFLIYSLNTKKTHLYEPQITECDVNMVRRMKALV